jgi:hypothetical protein
MPTGSPKARSAILVAVLATSILCACGLGRPPSDAAMIEHFRRERPAFDDLAEMVAQDRLIGHLNPDSLPAQSPEQRVRRETYRKLFRRTGCRWFIRDEDGRIDCNVPYPMSGGGVAGTGFKGYVYSTTAPSPLRPTLDADDGERFVDVYRHVEGSWYLSRMRI